jgi:hypothetical protein
VKSGFNLEQNLGPRKGAKHAKVSFHHRGSEFAEFGVFLKKILFSAHSACPRVDTSGRCRQNFERRTSNIEKKGVQA